MMLLVVPLHLTRPRTDEALGLHTITTDFQLHRDHLIVIWIILLDVQRHLDGSLTLPVPAHLTTVSNNNY